MQLTPSPRRLLHRWFVEYNPLYLASALVVLGGMIATSRGLAHEGSLYGPLGIALVAELYAVALVGGAALLTRIGQRRPAVLLALIEIVYQGDLTLHTETCAFLGGVGAVAAAAWLALFGAKLWGLAWALRVRLSARAAAAASLGALALALGPHVLDRLDARSLGAAIALGVFVIGSTMPRAPEDAVTSVVPLGDWGRTVLRRTVRAAWILFGVVFGFHVLFWSTEHPVAPFAVPIAAAFVALRGVHGEARAWTAVAGGVTAAWLLAP